MKTRTDEADDGLLQSPNRQSETSRTVSNNTSDVPPPPVAAAKKPATINVKALAAMLRECADLVEEDQFDAIMYQALQDFRAYYKAKVPRKKDSAKKGSSEDASSSRRRRKHKPVKAPSDDAAVEQEIRTKPAPDAPKPASQTATAENSIPEAAASASSGQNVSDTAAENDARTSQSPSVNGESAAAQQSKPATQTAVPDNTSKSGTVRVDTAVPISASASTSASSSQQQQQQQGQNGNQNHPSLKTSAAAVFGKMKMPKIHLANPSFAATSRKNANRVKAELEETTGPSGLIGKAESSNRRRAVSSGDFRPPAEWCEEHFTMGRACKLRRNLTSPRNVLNGSNNTTQPNTAVTENASDGDTNHNAGASTNGIGRATSDDSAAAAANDSNSNSTASSSNAKMHSRQGFRRPANPDSTLLASGWVQQQRRSKMRVVWKDVLATLVEGRLPGEETTLWIQRETTLGIVSGSQELEPLHQIPIKFIQDVAYLDYSIDNRFTVKVFNTPEEFVFRCSTSEDARNWTVTLRSVRDTLHLNSSVRGSRTSSVESQGGLFPTDAASRQTHPSRQSSMGSAQQQQPKRPQPSAPPASAPSAAPSPQTNAQAEQKPKPRLKISELRAICHGAGINTSGMERGELEKAAAEVEARGTYFEPPPGTHRPPTFHTMRVPPAPSSATSASTSTTQTQEQERARQEDERRRAEALRRQQEELERQRRLAEQKAAEQRRAQEQIRQQQQAAWQQQQAAWQRQQQENEQRRRAEEARIAEQRRQQEEAYRRQQQWYHQQQQAQWNQQQQQQHQQPWQQQQAQWNQQPQQQHWQQHQQQQQQHSHHQHQQSPNESVASQKYAKMASQETDDGQATITKIKHGILIQWALQPPMLQMLRPIEVLVTTIHNVFPPALNVKSHEYFAKWTPIQQQDVLDGFNRPDDGKLKKAVRKIRFFLHPDKLPRDLDAEQQFVVKMLWDITSDAWEEFHKKAEELGWAQ